MYFTPTVFLIIRIYYTSLTTKARHGSTTGTCDAVEKYEREIMKEIKRMNEWITRNSSSLYILSQANLQKTSLLTSPSQKMIILEKFFKSATWSGQKGLLFHRQGKTVVSISQREILQQIHSFSSIKWCYFWVVYLRKD